MGMRMQLHIHAVAEQRADLGVRQQSEAILMQHFAQTRPNACAIGRSASCR
jgi:hypothetical protein